MRFEKNPGSAKINVHVKLKKTCKGSFDNQAKKTNDKNYSVLSWLVKVPVVSFERCV